MNIAVLDFITPQKRLDAYEHISEFKREKAKKEEEAFAVLTQAGWKCIPPISPQLR